MKLWVVIPVKPFHESKSRLHDVLNRKQRAALSQSLLANVIETINTFVDQTGANVEGALVISRDPAVLRVAQDAGADVLLEMGHDLNSALDEARQQVIQFGADAMLVLPSDLPLLTVDDLQKLYAIACEQPSIVVIAPSRDGGTNALLLRPPHAIDFAFGPDSFQHHRRLASANDYACQIVDTSNLAFDIDWPQDLDELALLTL